MLLLQQTKKFKSTWRVVALRLVCICVCVVVVVWGGVCLCVSVCLSVCLSVCVCLSLSLRICTKFKHHNYSLLRGITHKSWFHLKHRDYMIILEIMNPLKYQVLHIFIQLGEIINQHINFILATYHTILWIDFNQEHFDQNFFLTL